jgi:hypothetical protein
LADVDSVAKYHGSFWLPAKRFTRITGTSTRLPIGGRAAELAALRAGDLEAHPHCLALGNKAVDAAHTAAKQLR